MDHPFLSRRAERDQAACGIALLADMHSLLSLQPGDVSHLVARREPRIEDAGAREAVMRHVSRLGLLADDVCDVASKVDASPPPPAALSAQWASFVVGGYNASCVDAASRAYLDALASHLRAVRDSCTHVEHDPGSSSESDYSDSRTETTDSDDDDDDGIDDVDELLSTPPSAPPAASPPPRRRRP